MGQRSNTETIVAILKAFVDQRTWKQAERTLDVAAKAIPLLRAALASG